MSGRTLEGTILVGAHLEAVEGRLHLEDGVIADIEEASVAAEDIICPTFTNAHTHLGDAVAKDAGSGLSLEDLVAPPDGLKHRLLRAADPADLVEGMRRSLRVMETGGVGACYDFREGGTAGVVQLREAAVGSRLDVVAFGRGDPSVLELADGYGASGAADASFEQARAAAREAGKPFGIHAGEVDAADINPALDLQPDYLVHMVHPAPVHFDRLDDADIPVVCCPRANIANGVGRPPIDALDARTTVALGTDNVMVNSPSMLRELAVTVTDLGVDPRRALRMATVNGASVLGRPDGVIEPGRPARVVVFDGGSDNLHGTIDPVRAITCRADRSDVAEVILSPVSAARPIG